MGSNDRKGLGPIKGPKKLGLYSDDEDDSPPQEGVDAVDAELARYWVEVNEEKLEVIDWWKVSEVRYPILAMVERRNLAVQATSAESERDFSAAGLVTSKSRLSLSSDSVNICIFCSINKQYVPLYEPKGKQQR